MKELIKEPTRKELNIRLIVGLSIFVLLYVAMMYIISPELRGEISNTKKYVVAKTKEGYLLVTNYKQWRYDKALKQMVKAIQTQEKYPLACDAARWTVELYSSLPEPLSETESKILAFHSKYDEFCTTEGPRQRFDPSGKSEIEVHSEDYPSNTDLGLEQQMPATSEGFMPEMTASPISQAIPCDKVEEIKKCFE